MTKHVTLRLDPELHSWLVAAADREHRSINGHIEWCLEQQRRREAGNPETREGQSGD